MADMHKVLLVLTAFAALSGCGEAKKAFDENFDKSFDKSFTESCIGSATRSGAPVAAAGQLCDCALKKINEKFTAAEKAGAASDEKLKPIMDECVKSVVQKNG